MIEVNLLPGGKKRSSKGRGFSGISLPSFGGGGLPTDPYLLGAIVAAIVAVGAMGWLFLGVSSDREETQVALDEAVQDSIRFADLIERTNQVIARRDSIAQRVAIIQEIDADRYIWPHIMDEIATALPDYTWLSSIVQSQADPLELRLSGSAGSTFAITTFMRNLEASRFLRGTTLERSEQGQAPDGSGDIINLFDLTVMYEPPPLEELETIPLFDAGTAAAQTAAPDTTGG